MKNCKIYNSVISAALFLLFLTPGTAAAQQQNLVRQVATVRDTTVWTLPVNDIKIKRNADLMTVGLNMKLADYKLKGDKVSVFTPVLVNGTDTLGLNSVGLYSRIRYIQYLRDGREGVSGPDETSYKYSARPDEENVDQSVPYLDWMSGSTLFLERCDYGCCHTLLNREFRFRRRSAPPWGS